ncbi:hypothetical protein Tco_1448906 [Tanacetum coccineum]
MILACYLDSLRKMDLSRKPRGWKSSKLVIIETWQSLDQCYTWGSSSKCYTVVELTNFEHTDLSIKFLNRQKWTPTLSDDDEVNPSTNVEEVLSSDDSDDDNRS